MFSSEIMVILVMLGNFRCDASSEICSMKLHRCENARDDRLSNTTDQNVLCSSYKLYTKCLDDALNLCSHQRFILRSISFYQNKFNSTCKSDDKKCDEILDTCKQITNSMVTNETAVDCPNFLEYIVCVSDEKCSLGGLYDMYDITEEYCRIIMTSSGIKNCKNCSSLKTPFLSNVNLLNNPGTWCGQRYNCLTVSYPGKSPHKKSPPYESPALELLRKQHKEFDSGFSQSNTESDDSDETEESEEAETGGGYGREQMEADEEVEVEDDEFETGFQNITDIGSNYTFRQRPIDDRKKRQAPSFGINRPMVNSTEEIMEVRSSEQNITSRSSRIDDSIRDDNEVKYDYEEYQDYESSTSNSTSTVTNTTTSYNSTEKFTGMIRCPNPSQKLHIRRVVTGYSSTGYCVRDTTYCSKDITDFKQVIDCEGVFGECKLELPIESHDSCENSNYVKIEYDCIYDHSLVDICSKIHVSRWREIAIQSPSYPASASVPSANIKTCECEIVTDDKSSLYISYLKSDMSGSDDKCDEEVLLFEEKYNANNSSRFQVTGEICGKKSSYSRRFGDNQIRMTYLIGGIDDTRKRGGFLSRISAHSFVRGNSLINVKCSSVQANAAGQANRNHPVRAVPTPIKRTIISPFFVKERNNVSHPVPILYHKLTTSSPQTATTPRWRIGPRGRKYIPRPGNPNGPIFLDGLGPAGVRRRYPSRIGVPRRYRPGLRRRIQRTTVAPFLFNFTRPVLPETNVENTTKYIEPTTATPNNISLTNKTAVAAVASNSAGAVKAGEEDISVNPAASTDAKGTLVAVIASMASILVIIVSVGFYYFYRKRQKALPSMSKVPSDTSSTWFSEYYYGITNFCKRKIYGDSSNTTQLSPDDNTDESMYESYQNDALNSNEVTEGKPSNLEIITTNLSKSKDNSQSIFGNTCTIKSQIETLESLEVKLVAPPRRKRNKLAPPIQSAETSQTGRSRVQQPPTTADYDNPHTPERESGGVQQRQTTADYDNSETPEREGSGVQQRQTTADYDNSETPEREVSGVQQRQTTADYDNPIVTDNTENNPVSDNTYDNCISAGTTRQHTPLSPIIEIQDNENTEYASIPEMISMFNSQC
ncbi:hypothetical protein LOTGIDRAFT_232714 [Lottia gigantea]|uniref:SUEL-type lectin domain-containing protein n=1 Tax=Lottia gigantea TaxID=225164 RepID=V4A930_LOTGI|nr:hypothetical protein LOTGIDRAFT_232714 [Lottia gigantea]ESO93272.1 hypothetical protein LOTGIDRAFT_232714 [Lottia gigantea]